MIEIVDYDARWPAEFASIARELRGALGELALRIDHIGSTAVPGLAAKDRIDVQVSIADFSQTDAIVARLAGPGYSLRPIMGDHVPPGWDASPSEWEKRFFRAPAAQRPTNLHVRVLGRVNQRYPLLFRDYLRSHPSSAAAYGELKRRLAQYLADPEVYPDVKDPACDLIAAAALDWAAATGWELGPPDA